MSKVHNNIHISTLDGDYSISAYTDADIRYRLYSNIGVCEKDMTVTQLSKPTLEKEIKCLNGHWTLDSNYCTKCGCKLVKHKE